MITFFSTDRNNFLNFLLLHFYVKSVTLADAFSGYISSNYIFSFSPFYYNRKYLLKKNLFSAIKVNIKILCCVKKRTLLKKENPSNLKFF
ncbi:MAG: hypothetical protein COZ25_03205 [Ignavibacteria bacterium CG_4_10_14_3_um_filter_37_18]|nr:MAG: hypothetical protein COZ25_03205 [Ignavibacteria bacterium CG_4_10_14_3_um_filter_37_18]